MDTNKIFASIVNIFSRGKVKKNRITLLEKLDTGGTGSLFELEAECKRRGGQYEFLVIRHADYEVSLRNIPGLIRLFTVKAHWLATSSWIFLNDNFIPMAYMNLSPETKVVQLWHGMGSFKKFGGSSEKDPMVLELIRQVNENVTNILASSVNIVKNYAEAFCVPEEKILTIGCPQADYYFRKHNVEAWRRKLAERFPQTRNKKLVLYAPTFREDEQRDRELMSHFDFEAFDRNLGEEYCLMVRLHPQIQRTKVPSHVVDMTRFPNVRQLLLMTDVLIADYSSIAVEYALLGKPILLYAWDKEWYLTQDRGFYFDFEKTAPGPVSQNMEELIRDIREERWNLDKVRSFAELHNDFYDDQSAARVLDYYGIC